MKICIPIEQRAEGGMYTFLGNLVSYLDAHGIAHTGDPSGEYDVLFVNSWAVPYDTIGRAKAARPLVRVVQRVDGSSRDYGGYSGGDSQQARVNLLADTTIFQSQYSRLSTTVKFHVVHQDGPVIYNPVDLELFRPDGPRMQFAPGRVTVACAAWSTNPGKGAHAIELLAARHPEIDFVLCGRFEGLTLRPNLVRLGHVSRADMAQVLRSCDVFLNLSEHDPAPNVVIEALASGAPVLYRDSGGVPELVGPCGRPTTIERFRTELDVVLHARTAIAEAARARAVREFAPQVVFPKYLDAMRAATRRPLPTTWSVLRLAAGGFPVMGALAPRRVGHPVRERARTGRTIRSADAPCRVGWVTYDSFPLRKTDFRELDSFTGMRVGNVARWLNARSDRMHHELYDPAGAYDIVVFQKMMDARCQAEVRRLHAAGTAVVFDANVNYWEIWGDYFIPGTKPTERQQRDAVWMTQHADWVVADSSYLAAIARKLTPSVTWIPDNVDLDVYKPGTVGRAGQPLTLVWSGVSKKIAHVGLIREVLTRLPGCRLLLVTDDPNAPEVASILAGLTPGAGQVLRFSDHGYAAALADADVIISPKYLINGYEMGHTEYKISLGMAVGLPAVASPQPSYIEAISCLGGGIVARTAHEWLTALTCLAESPERRASMGELARRTVAERYATPVVAGQYLDLFTELMSRTTAGIM